MVGIFSWYGINIPFLERIELIKAAGFDSVSIWIGDKEKLVSEGKGDLLPKIVRDYGLYLENAHAPGDRVNGIWDRYRSNEMKKEFARYISFCSQHKIPIMVMHITEDDEIKELEINRFIHLVLLTFAYAPDRPDPSEIGDFPDDNSLLLGISIDTTFDEEKAKQYDVPAGVLISNVQLFSGAAVAGIMINDIITKFDGQEVKTFNDLKTLINKHNPGDTVEIEVYRNSEKTNKIFNVTLTEDVGTSTN